MKKKSWKPFHTPYTREERERVAKLNGYKDEADFVRKRYNSVRTQIGLATPSYDASGPILNASVIRSSIPGLARVQGRGRQERFPDHERHPETFGLRSNAKGVRMKTLLLLLTALACSGCVSLGYHQRTVKEARDAERQRAVLLAEQVRGKRMTANEMIRFLEEAK